MLRVGLRVVSIGMLCRSEKAKIQSSRAQVIIRRRNGVVKEERLGESLDRKYIVAQTRSMYAGIHRSSRVMLRRLI